MDVTELHLGAMWKACDEDDENNSNNDDCLGCHMTEELGGSSGGMAPCSLGFVYTWWESQVYAIHLKIFHISFFHFNLQIIKSTNKKSVSKRGTLLDSLWLFKK